VVPAAAPEVLSMARTGSPSGLAVNRRAVAPRAAASRFMLGVLSSPLENLPGPDDATELQWLGFRRLRLSKFVFTESA